MSPQAHNVPGLPFSHVVVLGFVSLAFLISTLAFREPTKEPNVGALQTTDSLSNRNPQRDPVDQDLSDNQCR